MFIMPRLGERRAMVAGLLISSVAMVCYGLASEGWMMLTVVVVGSVGGIATPAAQSLVAGQVPSSEQGSVQGTITLRVAPVDDQDEVLAGGLTCEWWSNNPDVADVVGDETDNVVEVTANQAGTAIINVHLGDLTAQTTVEVGG